MSPRVCVGGSSRVRARACLQDAAGKKFREIAEAYDVLADKERRAAFDQYGDAGGAGGGYSFGGDAAEIFGRFFGTANPFEAFALGGGADAGDFAALFGGRGRGLAKGEPATRQLECSLEELYSGCTKTVKVTRKVGAPRAAAASAASLARLPPAARGRRRQVARRGYGPRGRRATGLARGHRGDV